MYSHYNFSLTPACEIIPANNVFTVTDEVSKPGNGEEAQKYQNGFYMNANQTSRIYTTPVFSCQFASRIFLKKTKAKWI
jgi:hypothetical protein